MFSAILNLFDFVESLISESYQFYDILKQFQHDGVIKIKKRSVLLR